MSRLYNDIRTKLVERETHLKRKISDTLEREQAQWKRRVGLLEEQMNNIEMMKDEAKRMEGEGVIEVLRQAGYRAEIEGEANQKVEMLTFKQVFNELKRDEEL